MPLTGLGVALAAVATVGALFGHRHRAVAADRPAGGGHLAGGRLVGRREQAAAD